MSAANITPQVNRQDDQADDGLDVPDFLKLTAADRRRAWARFQPRALPAFVREMSETERLYRASIERDKAAKRAADEIRFQTMRAKATAEKAERRSRASCSTAKTRGTPRAPRGLNSPKWARPPRRGRPRINGREGPTQRRRALGSAE